ncbi:MAG: hypothetical protein RSB71_00820 [Bacilli bacterium]
MKYLVFFLIGFVIVYLFYLFTVILQTKRMSKFKKSNQVIFFVKKYGLDVDKLNMKKFTNLLGLTNSFIVATAFTATLLVDNFILGMVVGLIVLVPLMLFCYYLLGNYFKKEGKKNV